MPFVLLMAQVAETHEAFHTIYRAKTPPQNDDLKFSIHLLLHVVRIFWKFQVPHHPGSHIMAFLSFPYFWCIRVSPIKRLSIKFEYFLRPSEILISSDFLGRIYTVNSESEVRIQFNDRFDCQFLHFTSLSDEFLVQLQKTNAKKLLLRIPLKLAKKNCDIKKSPPSYISIS